MNELTTSGSGAGPTGPAGGDLTGTYPDPTVAKLQGSPVSNAALTNGAVLATDGTTWNIVGASPYYGTNTQTNSGTNCVTFGADATTAAASNSTAVGPNAVATGANGTSLGYFAQATANPSLAAGYNTVATATFTTAVGTSCSAIANQASAFGNFANAQGDSSVALGQQAQATGTSSFAGGKTAVASGANGVAVGVNSVANVTNGVAVGSGATTNGIATSVAVGAGASPNDASHALAIAVNASSVTPQSVGLTVNTGSRSVRTFGSLYATTAGAGPTTLTATSAFTQIFTTAQTVVLPVTSTLELGFMFSICNRSGGNLVVQSSGGNTIITLATLTKADLVCILTSGTTAASWSAWGPTNAT